MLNKAVINIDNLRYNARRIKSLLKRDVKFCAVVKADAYGHGAVQVANALYDIVDVFAVAIVEEGVSLRLGGIDKPVLVLIPVLLSDLERAIYYNLELTVSSLLDVKRIEKQAKLQNRRVSLHVKINTGMNRNGVDTLDDLKKILEYAKVSKHLKVQGVYSHFSNAENIDSVNNALNKFLLAIKCASGYNKDVTYHISASGGLLQGVQFDMVRIGIMLYGYLPFKTDKIKLKPVMKIYAPVIARRSLHQGDTALYGDKKADKDIMLNLIRYGYADGLFRKEATGLFNNRCMDISAVPCKNKTNYAIVLDDAEKLADQYGTISYEILCRASQRAEKIYRRNF